MDVSNLVTVHIHTNQSKDKIFESFVQAINSCLPGREIKPQIGPSRLNELFFSVIGTEETTTSSFDTSSMSKIEMALSDRGFRCKVHITEQGDLSIIDADMFVAGIDRWVNDPLVTGDKLEAAKEIKAAFFESKKFLNLNKMGLNKLPAEIGRLSALESMNVSENKLNKLPAEIGSLSALEELYACENELNELPAEIGRLSALKSMNVSENQLNKLPAEIGRLSALKKLFVRKNQLNELPAEIGSLSALEELFVYENQLKELPITIGELFKLTHILFNNNQELRTLPMSLGNVPGITYLNINDTSIPEDLTEAILEACQAKRNQNAQFDLMPTINLWKKYAGYTGDLSFIDNFEVAHKNTLHEWLIRLAKTQDFAKSQGELARTICEMLTDLKDNAEWKAFCISHAEANNTRCEDRAAMALNELYTQWKVCVDKGLSEQEKIKLYIGLSKTLALREAIQDSISLQEKNGVSMGESVEIFLYYEIALKKELGLITAMNEMRYTTIGKRDWIKESDLIDAVNTNYINYIIEFEPFRNILEKSDVFKKAWAPLEEEFSNKSEALSENQSQMNEQELVEAYKRLQHERERNWKLAAKTAAQNILAQNPLRNDS